MFGWRSPLETNPYQEYSELQTHQLVVELSPLIFAFIPTLILTTLEVLGIVETLVKGEVRNNHNKVNMQLRAALFGQTVFTGVQVFGNTAGGFLWVVYTQDGSLQKSKSSQVFFKVPPNKPVKSIFCNIAVLLIF